MASRAINLSQLGTPNWQAADPAPPAGQRNVGFQTDYGFPVRNISAFVPNLGFVDTVAAASYTLAVEDQGRLKVFTDAAEVAITLPTLPSGEITSLSVVPNDGGVDWVNGDSFQIIQPGSTSTATGQVLTSASGEVRTVALITPGTGYVSAASLPAPALPPSIGQDLFVSIQASLVNDFVCFIEVLGAGGAVLTPASGTINGAGSLTLAQNDGAVLFYDGYNWWASLGAGENGVQSLNGETGAITLEAGSGITITEPSANVIEISATGGGVAAATPLLPFPWHQFVNSGWDNYTIWGQVAGERLLAYPTSWKFQMGFGGGTGVSIDACVILRTLTGSLTVIDSTTVTFASSPTYVAAFPYTPNANHLYVVNSDAIALTLDATHDYWIFVYFNTDGTGYNSGVGIVENSLSGYQPSIPGGYATGNQTTVTTIPSLVAPLLFTSVNAA